MQGFFFQPPLEQNFWGHIFAEIYKEKVYEPFLSGKKDLTILDIGANLGIASYYFSQYSKQVYALEPAQEHFEILTHMVEFNELKNIKPIKKALFMENTTLPFFHNPNKTMYSLHMAVNDPNLPPEQVETITLDKLFEDEGIDHVDLMKLDVEGSEGEILGSEGFRKVADKIDLLIMELHAWVGRNPNQIKESLKNNGFKVETLPNDAEILVAKR